MPTPPRLLGVVPPVWFMSFLALAAAAHFLIPATRVFDITRPLISGAIAALLVVAGLYLSLRASNIFAIEKTDILPASPSNRVLVTRGPFRISRNPMYLGMILLLLGMAVWIGTLPFFLAALAHLLVLNFVFIPFEEKKLAHLFGGAYESYRHEVRRWL